MTKFWSLVAWGRNEAATQPVNHISPLTWDNHFEVLYNNYLPKRALEGQNFIATDQTVCTWTFGLCDVETAVGAPGSDGIPGDIFILDKSKWPNYILLLSNAIAYEL